MASLCYEQIFRHLGRVDNQPCLPQIELNIAMKGVTSYSGLTGIYFLIQLKILIGLFHLRKEHSILDFGCGYGMMKKELGPNVIGYDLISELSDTSDWRKESFGVFVANHVLYCLNEEELRGVLQDLVVASNGQCRVIVGYSYQSLVIRFFMVLLGRPGAHDGTKLTYKQQLEIVGDYFCAKRHFRVPGLFGFCEFS